MKNVHAVINIEKLEGTTKPGPAQMKLTPLGRKILAFHRRTGQPKSARYIVCVDDAGSRNAGVGPLRVVWMIKGGGVWDISEDL